MIAKYERWIQTQPRLLARLPELKGKRLGCFCAGPGGLTAHDNLICHGQVLARLADAFPDPPAVAPTTLRVASGKRTHPHREQRTYRGILTTNQAEYMTLIAALEYILDVLARTQREPGQFVLEIAGDSALVMCYAPLRDQPGSGHLEGEATGTAPPGRSVPGGALRELSLDVNDRPAVAGGLGSALSRPALTSLSPQGLRAESHDTQGCFTSSWLCRLGS